MVHKLVFKENSPRGGCSITVIDKEGVVVSHPSTQDDTILCKSRIDFIKYCDFTSMVIGKPYMIEKYNYSKVMIATFYDKEV